MANELPGNPARDRRTDDADHHERTRRPCRPAIRTPDDGTHPEHRHPQRRSTHEGISDPEDQAGVARVLWVIDVDVSAGLAEPDLPHWTVIGGPDSYPACQGEARRLRDGGAQGLRTVSAALKPGTAGGYRVQLGLRDGPPADGQVIVLFGRRPHATGWQVVDAGRPPADLLDRVRPL